MFQQISLGVWGQVSAPLCEVSLMSPSPRLHFDELYMHLSPIILTDLISYQPWHLVSSHSSHLIRSLPSRHFSSFLVISRSCGLLLSHPNRISSHRIRSYFYLLIIRLLQPNETTIPLLSSTPLALKFLSIANSSILPLCELGLRWFIVFLSLGVCVSDPYNAHGAG